MRPFADSAVLVSSVIAQLLLMGPRIEDWLFWLAVNSIAVPLYASRGLYPIAVLYALYWGDAVVSWMWWRRGRALQVRRIFSMPVKPWRLSSAPG